MLPIEQYPTIAPPAVQISAQYSGASAETVENTVVQVIEQQMSGLDHLLYMSSTSDDSGSATITVTFAAGTNRRHRAGPGPEQAAARHTAAARGGPAGGHQGHEIDATATC